MSLLDDQNLRALAPADRARRLIGQYFSDGIGVYAGGRIHLGDGEGIRLLDASTGAFVASYTDPGAEGAELAVRTAIDGASRWGALNPFDRAAILRRVAVALEEHGEELAILETATTSKPIRDTRVEAARIAEMYAYYAGWADKSGGRTIPVPGDWLTYTQPVPYGVVVAVTPWNAPMFTAAWNSAPALAAGNAVIVKPSEFTPLTSLRIAAIAEEAGLPSGVLTVAPGLGQTLGAALTSDPRVGKVTFIGSVPTGKRVAVAAAQSGTPALLELGGKSANIVFADADLERAAYGAVSAVFSGAGQSCVAGSRLLVQESVHEEFIARVVAAAGALRMGDPMDPDTEVGPIIATPQLATIRSLIEIGRQEGATLHENAATRSTLAASGFGDGNWVLPTVLDGVSATDTIERSEVFGPVLAAASFVDETEAVARANNTDFGLAGAVWTADVSRAHRVARDVRAGTFWINSYKTIHVAVPFGGFGDSGWGRSSGPDVLSEYSQSKAVWLPTQATGAPFPSMSY